MVLQRGEGYACGVHVQCALWGREPYVDHAPASAQGAGRDGGVGGAADHPKSALPQRGAIDTLVQEQLIVEFYSK